MIRVGLAGTGSMGTVHANAYRDIPGVAVVGVVGRDQGRTATIASSLNAHPYTDLEVMLRMEKPDVLDCAFPTFLHRTVVERGLAHGCQIICEKPLALTVEDAQAMITAARAAGARLLVGQVVRFFPEYRRIAAALRGGAVGTPVTLALLRQGAYPTGRDTWFRDDARSGGVFVDLMLHDLDWALTHLGPAERIYARLVSRREPVWFAQAMATVRHRSGAISQVAATWGNHRGFLTSIELAGDGGLVRHHSHESSALHSYLAQTPDETGGVSLPNLAASEDPYRTELAHFIEVLAGRAEPLVVAEQSLAALVLALAARRSAETGQVVSMEVGE
ncbi:MAG TPA: Gfo/Idh/MocA family oxidoreductase [Chloroflexota bacterium]|nr:Gfo/Idh/MocA family oxidoreductase [Chloroflexota bacterium]